MLKLSKYYYDYLVIFLISTSIFYWDVKFSFLEFRFFFLLLSVPFFYYCYKEYLLKKNYILIIKYLFIFIFTNLFYQIYYFGDLKLKNFLLFFVLILSILIVVKNGKIFKEKFNVAIDFFLYSFVSLTLIYYFYNFDIFINTFNVGCSYLSGMFSEKQEVLKGVKRIFLENSHFAMVSVGTIFYYIFTIELKKNFFSYLKLIYFIFFLLISLHNFSFVFFAGLIISFIAILISNFNKVYLKKYFLILLLILISYYVVIKDDSCKTKILNLENYSVTNKKELILNLDNNINYNLSFAVFLQHLDISIQSFVDYPFGVGFNNYEFSYNKYQSSSTKYHHNLRSGQRLNFKDGSNNLFKLIVEFGIFSFLLFFLIFIYCFSNKIPNNIKFFIIPLLLIQTFLRASGYFNGGYLILVIFFLYLGLRSNY